MNLDLLPRQLLVHTGSVDYADWNYRPVLGWIERARFHIALDLLPPQSDMLLEVGFGSGVFQPALRRRCSELHGVDIHDLFREVERRLREHGVETKLRKGRGESLPYESGMFDCIVTVSCLEFVEDIDATARELRRVLRRDGKLVVITPGCSPVVDMGLKFLTGKSASSEFGDSRQKVIPGLLSQFDIRKLRRFPPGLGLVARLYTGLLLTPRQLEAVPSRPMP